MTSANVTNPVSVVRTSDLSGFDFVGNRHRRAVNGNFRFRYKDSVRTLVGGTYGRSFFAVGRNTGAGEARRPGIAQRDKGAASTRHPLAVNSLTSSCSVATRAFDAMPVVVVHLSRRSQILEQREIPPRDVRRGDAVLTRVLGLPERYRKHVAPRSWKVHILVRYRPAPCKLDVKTCQYCTGRLDRSFCQLWIGKAPTHGPATRYRFQRELRLSSRRVANRASSEQISTIATSTSAPAQACRCQSSYGEIA